MENRTYSYKKAVAAEQNIEEGEYWLNKLSGHLVKSSFPYDFKKEDVNGSRCPLREEAFEFPEALLKETMKLSKGIDVKLHMILVTGLFILLHKYGAGNHIIIGSPLLKQQMECEFINTVLVFRDSVNDHDSFRQLLLRVRETIIGANKNQNYPMEQLLERLNIPAAGKEFPLFDIVILLENLYDKSFIEHIHYNVGFLFSRTDAGIRGRVAYNPALYRESTIKRITGHYMHVLDRALVDVNLEIARLELLSEQEKRRVLLDFNRTGSRRAADQTLLRLFEGQVEKTPGNTAVIGKEHGTPAMEPVEITYEELNKRAGRLACLLQEKGVKPDTIVGLMTGRSIEMMVGIMGILKAGGAYLPLDSNYPGKRIDFMLKDSRAAIAAVDRDMTDNIPIGPEIISLPPGDGNVNSGDARDGAASPGPHHLAYVIYTSGTTGKPKGVMVGHGNAAAYLHAFYREFEIKPGDTVIQLASYSFDVFVEEVFPVLLRGGKIIIPDEAEMMDIQLLARLIAKYRVGIIDCTPLLLNQFNKLDARDPAGKALAGVHTFIGGGDVLKKEYVDNLLRIGTVYNTYGPTETTVCATYFNYSEFCRREDPGAGIISSIPVGGPTANYKVYILDRNGMPVPVGVTGEICIAGAGVTRGYLNRPGLTAEKFVMYRTAPGTGAIRIYRTGDLARWLPDGNIEFSGRKDRQVKIRGYRVESGEIENRLLKKHEIKDVVVTAREDNKGEKYLCVYIISAGEFQTLELREYLAGDLPDHMIPGHFVRLEKFPLTVNGKIDVKALPAPELEAGADYAAPGNEIEEKLVGLWSESLAVEKEVIGIDRNFFELGGHSLNALVLLSKIHKELNVKVPLAEIFRTPTVRGLAGYITAAVQDRYSAIRPVEKREYYPLSSAQKRLYIFQQMDLESTVYNMPLMVSLEGVLEKDKLENAFGKLINRHESFRTSFQTVNDEPVQVVHDRVSFEIGYYGPEAAADRGFAKTFALSRAPLLRVGLINTGEARYILMVDIHHIIFDAVSGGILTGDFTTFYRGGDLPPLKLQYKDYSQWRGSAEETAALARQEEYWLRVFPADIPPGVGDLPTDFPRPESLSFEGNTFDFEIGKEGTEALKVLALKEGVTVHIIMLAIFVILLSKLTGRQDIAVGTTVVGRRHADLRDIIGMFVNTLALRNFPSQEKSFPAFLKEVKENSLDAYENQDYPFEDLVEKVLANTARDASRGPLFAVMFELRNAAAPVRRAPGTGKPPLEVKPYRGEGEGEGKSAKVDLDWFGVNSGENISFTVIYNTQLFKKETVKKLAGRYKEIVVQVVEDSEIKLKDIVISHDFIMAKSKRFRENESAGFGF